MNYVHEILRTMNGQLDRIHACLDLLDEEEIWRRFKPNMNTVGHLCIHLAGNEHQHFASGIGNRYQHFASGIGNRPFIRQRTLEFTTDRKYARHELKKLFASGTPPKIGSP